MNELKRLWFDLTVNCFIEEVRLLGERGCKGDRLSARMEKSVFLSAIVEGIKNKRIPKKWLLEVERALRVEPRKRKRG